MDIQRFETLVARLERESAARPRAYLLRVAALALGGYALLAAVLGVAGFGLLLIAGIAVAALWTGGAAIVALLKLGKLLILLAIPLWFLVKSALASLFVRLPAPQGRPVTRDEAPALFAAVERMRRTLRGPKVHQVLLVDEMNAAIVQRPLFGLVGFPRNYLILGLPLLESMTPDEALAVVAHEYGHLAGSHGRFAAFIYRLRHTWGTIQAVASQWQGLIGRALGRVIGWYAPHFNAYTFVLARANEYQADRTSADLVGSAAAASALKRVNLATAQHQAFLGEVFDRIRDEPRPPADMAARWAAQATAPMPAAQRWLDDALDRKGQPTDTHPTLRQRLTALLPEGASAALPETAVATSAAQAWLGAALPALRDHFQSAWADGVAAPWAERHEAVLAQRQRLAALRAQLERSVDETFESLQLQVQLEPETDARDALAAFNAAHPGHLSGLYLEGSVRLERDDEAGIDLIEQVIARDPEATKPGCEALYRHFLRRKDEAAAERCAERWRTRDALETARASEAARPQASHALVAADKAAFATLREQLLAVDRQGVAAVYFARRVLPSDPGFTSLLVAIDLTWWAGQRGRQQQIVDRYAAAVASPVHLIFVTLGGEFAALRKPLKKLPGARLA